MCLREGESVCVLERDTQKRKESERCFRIKMLVIIKLSFKMELHLKFKLKITRSELYAGGGWGLGGMKEKKKIRILPIK